MSLVFHRRTAHFRRQNDENSRSLSGPGLRPIPGPRPQIASLVEQSIEIRLNRASGRNLAHPYVAGWIGIRETTDHSTQSHHI